MMFEIKNRVMSEYEREREERERETKREGFQIVSVE